MVWGLLLSLLALSCTGVFADPRFAYPEDVRGGRIVSGWEAAEGQFPYQLSLRMVNSIGGVTACGASLVHHEWAITAAHCTAQRITVVIRAGAANLTRPAVIFETTDYYNYPLYNEALGGLVQPHDIGLIKFNRFIEYTDQIYPIRIQSYLDRNVDYSGVRLRAAGWGRTWTSGSSPEHMNWVFLTGVSNFDCWIAFGGSPIIVESTICARYYNVTSQSTCQGDSGGTLIVKDYDGGDTLVGVTSFVSSLGCHVGFPAGFIRPGHYHNWFLSVTGVDFDWDRRDPEDKTTTTTTEANEITTETEKTTTEDWGTTTEATETTTEEWGTTTEATETTTEEWGTTTEATETTTEEWETTEPSELTTEPEESSTEDWGTTPEAPEITPEE